MTIFLNHASELSFGGFHPRDKIWATSWNFRDRWHIEICNAFFWPSSSELTNILQYHLLHGPHIWGNAHTCLGNICFLISKHRWHIIFQGHDLGILIHSKWASETFIWLMSVILALWYLKTHLQCVWVCSKLNFYNFGFAIENVLSWLF